VELSINKLRRRLQQAFTTAANVITRYLFLKLYPIQQSYNHNLMKTALILLVAGSLTVCAETREQLNKRFEVQADAGKLVVEVDFGSIEINTNGGNNVVIDALRKVTRSTKEQEEEFFRDHPVLFQQDGNKITISSRPAKKFREGSHGRERTEGKYSITVPSAFSAQLQTAGGAVVVNDLQGGVSANSSGGELKFARLHGDLEGHTAGGSIKISDCEGALRVRTSGGAIDSRGGGGTLDGATSGGPITVVSFRGPAHVQTAGGGITLEDVTGKVDGTTSGGSISARFTAPVSEEIKLQTSAGGVTLKLPESSAFELDASTSAGSVRCDLPIVVTGKAGASHMRGPVNGGGKKIVLRSSAGGIRVSKS
jgi:DUF4097 and DUF4098 domain-containing protein YvlB